jgi:hypothetical protein
MGLRDRFDAVADRVASVVSRVFVTAPDHPGRGGMTGEGDDWNGSEESAESEEEEPSGDDSRGLEAETR